LKILKKYLDMNTVYNYICYNTLYRALEYHVNYIYNLFSILPMNKLGSKLPFIWKNEIKLLANLKHIKYNQYAWFS